MVMHLVLDSPVVMARSSSSRFPFFFSFFTRLCIKEGYKEAIRPNGLMEDGAKKEITSDMGYQEWVPDVVTAFEACEVQVI